MKSKNFLAQAILAKIQLLNAKAEPKELSPEQNLLTQIYYLDREAESACINFLIDRYPQLKYEQAQKLIGFIFDNNFKARLPNHFGRISEGRVFGYPYIWLLNELKTGGIRYLYENGIWQIHWDGGDRYGGMLGRSKTVKYLLTNGPVGDEQRLWEEHGLIFYMYTGATLSSWQYPFPEDADLSSSNEYLLKLKLTAQE